MRVFSHLLSWILWVSSLFPIFAATLFFLLVPWYMFVIKSAVRSKGSFLLLPDFSLSSLRILDSLFSHAEVSTSFIRSKYMLFWKLKIEAWIWHRHRRFIFRNFCYLVTALWRDKKELRSTSSIVTLLQQFVQGNQHCEACSVNPNGKNIATVFPVLGVVRQGNVLNCWKVFCLWKGQRYTGL